MAIRINRVYTRSGDDGLTALVGGTRVSKDDRRVTCYGEVDELNSVLGLVRACLFEPPLKGSKTASRSDDILELVQQELFDLGSQLATPQDAHWDGMLTVKDEHIKRIERFIDELQNDLEPLKSFVLPGGGRAGATLHLARTVCRRAERSLVALVRDGDADAATVGYLNRLSDLFFVQARCMAAAAGEKETLWQNGLDRPTAK